MKSNIIILLFIAVTSINVYSQTSDTINIKELDIPSSPAFMLLDRTPTIIDRPNSSKAFVIGILNSFDQSTGLPTNYAVDLTPFWFFKHPTMSALKFAGYNVEKQKQNIFENIKRASISIAYVTSTDSITLKPLYNIALGLRFNLISVRSKKDIDDINRMNLEMVSFLKNSNDRLDQFIGDPALKVTNPTLYHTKVKEFYEQDVVRKTHKEDTYQQILARKPVFAIDGAIAYNQFFIDNNYSDSHKGRYGAWLTLNLSKHLSKNLNDKNYLNVYAIGRYLSNGTYRNGNTSQKMNFFDSGAKMELEFNKLTFAYEYIYRINNAMNSFRSNCSVRYKMTNQLYLNGAFGKNFGDSNNLIALLGLNWGLSSGLEKATVK